MIDQRLVGHVPTGPGDPRLRDLDRKVKPKLKRAGPQFPMVREVIALFRFWKDPQQPWSKRAIAAAALLYFIMPIDVIPDCLPGGYLDDALVIALAIRHLAGAIRPYLREDGNSSTQGR